MKIRDLITATNAKVLRIFDEDRDVRISTDTRTIQNGDFYLPLKGASFDGEKFIGADLTAVFGGVKCDLRNAIIESDVVINASSTFAGIEIYVPSDVEVKIKSNSIFE